jgi:hypothetical protein
MKWFKYTKGLIKSATSLEKETGVGKYNLVWARYTFIVYILSLMVGTGISYFPKSGWNPLNGFALQIGDSDFDVMTLIVIITPLLCIGILVYCWKIGLVDSSFKPKK